MSTVHDRRLTSGWLRRQVRRSAILATGVISAAGLLAGSVVVLPAVSAEADTTVAPTITGLNCAYWSATDVAGPSIIVQATGDPAPTLSLVGDHCHDHGRR
jgi:hypothetical protein